MYYNIHKDYTVEYSIVYSMNNYINKGYTLCVIAAIAVVRVLVVAVIMLVVVIMANVPLVWQSCQC